MPQLYPDKPPRDTKNRDAALARRRAQGRWNRQDLAAWREPMLPKECRHQWKYGARDPHTGEANERRCTMSVKCGTVQRWDARHSNWHTVVPPKTPKGAGNANA